MELATKESDLAPLDFNLWGIMKQKTYCRRFVGRTRRRRAFDQLDLEYFAKKTRTRLPCIGADFGQLPSNEYQPTVKLKAKNNMDPPPCVQNAMMTKDKKPFTYTPGGIDLSEVRSPRMQRRIERNANLGSAADMPKPPHPSPQNIGSLPPSALAVMRPQTQVQVFPGPPPPPPMQKNIPPPPPPPSCPLPTQKVTTGDNQVLERPDMTKIIPENPMALLRKTGGPAPRKSLVDEMYEEQSRNPPSSPQRSFETQSPRYQPPIIERSAPASPPTHSQHQQHTYQPQPQQCQLPPTQQNQQQATLQPIQSPQSQYQRVQPEQRSTDSPKPSGYQPPIIERQPIGPPQRNVSSNVGTLYIPPLGQQSQQQKIISPLTQPEIPHYGQNPGTPPLKEAPRPWQQKNAQQQQEIPPWAKKDNAERTSTQSPPSAPSIQQRWQPQSSSPQEEPQQPIRSQTSNQQFSPRPQPHQAQQQSRAPPRHDQSYPSNSFPVHIEIRTGPYQSEAEPSSSERNPNAVYVTQPIVLQHPGTLIEPPYKSQPTSQAQSQQYPQKKQQVPHQAKVDSSGARIIPIQIEGRTPPSTPGGERNLSRQLSWGTQPSQSSSFKVIQKLTNTDENEDDDTPVTHHSPRYTQEMPEQVRGSKNNGQFRQVPQPNSVGKSVQAEDSSQSKPYIHPSEQVVPEPKKYMGSNIPSRSFKMLQAMTAPTGNCASANNEEIPYHPLYHPFNYSYYPPVHCPQHFPDYFPQEQSQHLRGNEKIYNGNGRVNTSSTQSMSFTQPYWQHFHSSNYSQEQPESTSKMSDRTSKSFLLSRCSTPQTTAYQLPPPMPPPYWGYVPVPSSVTRPRSTVPKAGSTLRSHTPDPINDSRTSNTGDTYFSPVYSPYFDPFYHSYYYGYPSMIPPYFYYPTPFTENEEYNGYSSMDEMSDINSTSRRYSLKRRNSLDNNVQSLRQHFEVRSKSATPRIIVTPNDSQEDIIPPDESETNFRHSDTEIESNSNEGANVRRLHSIKSVQNINVYATNSDIEDTETSESEDSSEADIYKDEVSADHDRDEIPHQLSIIYEESERGDSRRSLRCSSVSSGTTTIADFHSEDEKEDFLSNQDVKYKINLFEECRGMVSLESVRKERVNFFNQSNEEYKNMFSDGKETCTNKCENLQCMDDDTKLLDLTISENFDNSDRRVLSEDIQKSILGSTGQVSNEDWGEVIQNEIRTNVIDGSEDSMRGNDKVSGNISSKADYVIVPIENEMSYVKLRNKPQGNESNDVEASLNNSNTSSSSESIMENDLVSSDSKRNSVYDSLKELEEEDEEISGGILMRVDSFASQLETIKTNSGFWRKQEMNLNIPSSVTGQDSMNSNDDADKNENNEMEHYTANEHMDKSHEEVQSECSGDPEEDIDFWSQIKKDEDDFTYNRRTYLSNNNCETTVENSVSIEHQYIDSRNNESDDSTNSRNSSFSQSHEKKETSIVLPNQNPLYNNICTKSQDIIENENESNDSSESDSSDDEVDIQISNTKSYETSPRTTSRSESVGQQSIKDRIEALRNSISQKQQKTSENEGLSLGVRSKISVIEILNDNQSKTTSTKSSIKSFEEYSEEEELDSGVISDISRHISDNEEFPELRKMTKYERAATHSRLFKLLQDECDIEEEKENEAFPEKEDKFSRLSVRQHKRDSNLCQSRSKLRLPLNKYNETDDEKGKYVNKNLVNELVESLLRSKRAQIFRSMPKDKLYAAAITILQEDIDKKESPSEEFSSILSPSRGDTESSTPAETPQEFYADNSGYNEYYDSWSDAAIEILPSRAFKVLQEHLINNKRGGMEGFLGKCPRIRSSKNLSADILESFSNSGSDCSPTLPLKIQPTNETTNT